MILVLGMSGHANNNSADDLQSDRYPLDSQTQPLFEAAFREHHASLVHYLRRHVGNDADARDIAQDTYLRVLRYRENQDLSSLKALVFRIATNLLGMRARTARAQRWVAHETLEEASDLPANQPSPEQRLFAEQQLNRLLAVIQRLPTRCRQVFVLSRFQDMSYPEIAARCGISVKMVEKHIAHGLAACRAEVGDELP